MPVKKPKRGVCGLCGTAVVAPSRPVDGWNEPDDGDESATRVAEFSAQTWGHLYVEGQLTRVRCQLCNVHVNVVH